jgi:glycosyltransferase involved in cell wall biosynthesis
VLELLPKFDALVLYSAYETFGITIFEARQAGLWAIHSSGLGGQPWYDDGCLEVSSEEELLIAMNQVLNLEAASKAAFPDLSPSAIGGMLKDLYREIVLKS